MKQHWESIYTTKSPMEVSWYQREPGLSLDLIRRVAPDKKAAIIDVGGGASTLVDALIASGYRHVTVVDIASAALRHSMTRLGERAEDVSWWCADILEAEPPAKRFDVWHDRAVFHFLTSAADRARYVCQVARFLKPNGIIVIGTFAADGPTRCSGLDVMRYSATALHAEFGPHFELIDAAREEHVTPAGGKQAFQYCVCAYRPAAVAAA